MLSSPEMAHWKTVGLHRGRNCKQSKLEVLCPLVTEVTYSVRVALICVSTRCPSQHVVGQDDILIWG